MSRAHVIAGDILGGKYRVERLLGEGAMGIVVAATHIERGGRFALKVLNPGLAGSSVGLARFDREARAASRIVSDHVARVFDVGVTELGAPFLVMEHLVGCDLASALDTGGALPLEEAVLYVLQACEGVAIAHDHGIIHRDLKPANLFLTATKAGRPCVKVLDFGLSKLSADTGAMSITTSCTILGTPLYMAPEQFASPREVNLRADVWALGVCLYELLTGEVPFCEKNIHRQYARIISNSAARPSLRRSDIPPALDDVVLRCLRRDPNARFASMRELAAALRASLSADALARVTSLSPSELHERAKGVSLAFASPGTLEMGDSRGMTTRKGARPRKPLPGGAFAWSAGAIASMAIAALIVVRARTGDAATETAPIVLYNASGEHAHRTLETDGTIDAEAVRTNAGEGTATLRDRPRSAPLPSSAASAVPSPSANHGNLGPTSTRRGAARSVVRAVKPTPKESSREPRDTAPRESAPPSGLANRK
jgi:eukaryotic-like serine/threonine-protein kinase